MRILHIVQNYFPSRGGTQWLFQQISQRLVEQYGDEVTVCTTDSLMGPEKRYYQPAGAPNEVLDGVQVKRFRYYRFHLPVLRALNKLFIVVGLKTPAGIVRAIHGPWSPSMARFINNFDGDVICASSSYYAYMLYPLNKNKSRPFVFMGAIHFTDNPQHNPVDRRMLQAIQASAFCVANTTYEKERLVAKGVAPQQVRVIGCGVDVAAFACNKTSAGFRQKHGIGSGKLVGFVGRHEPLKGIDELIEAMALLWKQDKDYLLMIAGATTGYTTVLKRKIAALGKYASRVFFVEGFSEEEKPGIYHSLDVFVSVSSAESFGIVFLEAWACKKPVIGAGIGAVRSVIEDAIDGYVVQPGNTKELALKINELCSNENKSTVMGNNGYQKVVNHYTWDIVAGKYRQLYIEAQQIDH